MVSNQLRNYSCTHSFYYFPEHPPKTGIMRWISVTQYLVKSVLFRKADVALSHIGVKTHQSTPVHGFKTIQNVDPLFRWCNWHYHRAIHQWTSVTNGLGKAVLCTITYQEEIKSIHVDSVLRSGHWMVSKPSFIAIPNHSNFFFNLPVPVWKGVEAGNGSLVIN